MTKSKRVHASGQFVYMQITNRLHRITCQLHLDKKTVTHEMREIREAMLRLSCIGNRKHSYAQNGDIYGDGPIHYLVEIGYLFFMAWEWNQSGAIIVNPITRFDLDELGELGAEDAWTVIHAQHGLMEPIQF